MKNLRDAIKILVARIDENLEMADRPIHLTEEEKKALETLRRATAGKVPGDE